jgi:nickel transport protein
MRTTIAVITLAVLLPATGLAHGVFWDEAPHGLVLMVGHPHGRGHGDQPPQPLPVSRLQLLLRADAEPAGGGLTWSEAAADTPIVAPLDAAAVLAVLDWGWWTKTAAGTRNEPPAGVAGALQAWTSRETVKHLSRWAEGANRPAGRDLELTPLSDPLVLKRGDKLEVLVTLDGAPVAGAVVAYDGNARGATGDDGRLRLKLREKGLQVIRATLRRPADDPPWAEDVRTATLTFKLGGGR